MLHEWTEAKGLIRRLNQKGYQTYIVGGAVRDHLLGRMISDIDLVTTATSKEVSGLFDKTVLLSKQHQTTLVKIGQELFEVTTIRRSSVEEDMQRRDLTINSLAMDEEGQLVDVVNGKVDLELKQLRSFDAMARMSEDPLRMLRVVRFMSELGFSIVPDLFNTIKENHSLIHAVAVERVAKEWVKILKGTYRKQALQLLLQTGLYHSIPGLSLQEQVINRLIHLKPLVDESEVICWSAFCLCMDDPTEENLQPLSLSTELLRAVKLRIEYFQKRKEQNWSDMELYASSINVAKDVEKLRYLFGFSIQDPLELTTMWNSLPIQSRSELAITGRDLLLEFKKEPGPWLKDYLQLAEKLVVTRKCLNEKSTIIKVIRKCEHC